MDADPVPSFTFHYASTLSEVSSGRVTLGIPFTFHYASTLSRMDSGDPQLEVDLHSTMLLLYHFFLSFISICLPIYIPLCFYFIRFIRLLRTWGRIYLHSTMLLLYPASHIHCRFRGIDLHSTMLLLYHYPETESQFPILIYIPLCFYFIPSWSGQRLSHQNLHSTMLLLYPGPVQNVMLLCYLFTFHYASTLSRNRKPQMHLNGTDLHSTMLLLYLLSGQRHPLLVCDLHSTMLLLYRWQANISVYPSSIYIPLCFYFIRRKSV